MKTMLSVLISVCAAAAFGLSVEKIQDVHGAGEHDLSATWLQTYWNKATGKNLRLLKPSEPFRSNAVYLGKAALEKGLVSKEETARAGSDGFVLKITENAIGIASESPWGLLCGVGRLGEMLGLRPTGNGAGVFPPSVPPRELKECTIIDAPAFFYRNGGNPLTGQLGSLMLGDPRHGADPELFRKKSDLWIDHTAGYLVPRLKYYDAHPEYYSMLKNGERIAKDSFTDHRTPLCLSNPDVTKISIERAGKWVELNPDKKFFYLTYGDTTLWCRCPECEKLDEQPGQYAGRLLTWVNAVADALGKKYPDRIFLTFAYAGSDAAPERIKPAGNVAVVVASSLGNRPFFAHELKQGGMEKMQETLKGWLGKGGQKPLVCEYIGGTYQPAFIPQTADRYRYLKKCGVGGIAFNYGNPVNFPKLWWYLHGKLLWNPEQDAMKLMEDYAPCLYGAAAPHVIAYLKLADAQYQKTLQNGKKLANAYPPDFYTPEFLRQACSVLDNAINSPGITETLRKELTSEKYLMLADAMKHLPDYNDGELVRFVLNEGNRCAKQLNRETEFARSNSLVLRELEKTLPPSRIMALKKQIGTITGAVPEKTAAGYRFPAAMWSGQDFGPKEYGPKNDPLSPPKLCAGVFTKAKGGRITSSAEMSLVFDLPEPEAGKEAVLNLEGQDAVSRGAAPHHLKNKEITMMRITLNGTVIYDGECGFAIHNWSRREFKIPAGVLKKENNSLVIRNTGHARGAFVYCWILISDAQLQFPGQQ